MASNVTGISNRQQGGSKGNENNRDVMALVEVRLIEINTTMSTLTDMVDDMNKYIKELEYEGDVEELWVEMQEALNSMLVDFNKEIQALQALAASMDGELQAYNAEVEAY